MNLETIVEGNFLVRENLELTQELFPVVTDAKDFKYFYSIYLNKGGVQPVSGYLTNDLKPGEDLGFKNDFQAYLGQHQIGRFSDLLFLLDYYRLIQVHGPKDYDQKQFRELEVVDDILIPSRGLVLWHYQLEQLFACFYQSQSKVIELRKAINQKQASVFQLLDSLKFKSGISLESVLNQRMLFPVTCSPNFKGAITLYQMED